jgi:hypothetical protein
LQSHIMYEKRVAVPCGSLNIQSTASPLQALCTAADVDAKATRAADLRKAQRQALLAALTAWPLDITGHEGYMKVSGLHIRPATPSCHPTASIDSAHSLAASVAPGARCACERRVDAR